MERRFSTFALVCIVVVIDEQATTAANKCLVREPENVASPASSGDAGFSLSIRGDPEFYEERKLYTVTLKGDKTQFITKEFIEFLLVVENSDAETAELPPSWKAKNGAGHTGSFQLLGDVLTRFSDHCTNTVVQTSSVGKTEIQVLWRAPPARSGCVVFKAVVVENRDVWAMDGGRLSVTVCEATVEEHSEMDDVTEPCCACEEAKYEVTFEGLWSQETHSKDFPANSWLLHFSDVIGASHSTDYRVWEYGSYASKGLEQMAKWGSPRVLESELKAESNHIRTIIKARGLWHPNLNGKTFAVFRTDKTNHLVSLVSMMGPSPDWIVGVSGLELCLQNCTWVNVKELFLYPWDAGVDDGISYESPDSASDPTMPITRLTSSHPDDPRQPFWNETGAPIKPMAKLTISRQRLYTKGCEEDDRVPDDEIVSGFNGVTTEWDSVRECETSRWSDWSSCSVACGKGISMRKRIYLMQQKAEMVGCNKQLIQKKMCKAANDTSCPNGQRYYSPPKDGLHKDDVCLTSEWSQWSECSTSCGKGFISRTRRFFNRMGRKKCLHVETMEKQMCAGKVSQCPSREGAERQRSPHCAVTSWSEWSPCSVTCGKGLKVRTRLYMVSPQQQRSARCSAQLMEKVSCKGPRSECQFSQKDAQYVCGLKKEMGPCRGYFPRWHFDPRTKMCLQFVYGGCRGNSNNFERYEDCVKLCEIPRLHSQRDSLHRQQPTWLQSTKLEGGAFRVADGEVNENNDEEEEEEEVDMDEIRWKMMDLQEEHQSLSGRALVHAAGPSNVYETKEQRIQQLMEEERVRQMLWTKGQMMYDGPTTFHPPVDCLVTSWSPWSECGASCNGPDQPAFREKFRMIKRRAAGGGKTCPKKLRRREKCQLPPCHNECILGEWGNWSECSKSCGGDGVQERIRDVENEPGFEGRPCGPKIERRICVLSDCLQ